MEIYLAFREFADRYARRVIDSLTDLEIAEGAFMTRPLLRKESTRTGARTPAEHGRTSVWIPTSRESDRYAVRVRRESRR